MLLKTLRDIYFVYNRNLSTDTTFSKYNWTEILYQHLPIIGHIFIKNKQTNTYYIYTCLLLVMYSLKPKQTNKQTNKHILYLPLIITGHVFIKTKTSKNIKANAKQKWFPQRYVASVHRICLFIHHICLFIQHICLFIQHICRSGIYKDALEAKLKPDRWCNG